MPERDELDLQIDSELARYAEPRPGLEQRVLARVEAEPSPRFWSFAARQRALVVAIAAAIVLAIGIPLSMHHNTSINTAAVTRPNREPIGPAITATAPHPEVPLSRQPANRAQRTPRKSRIIEVARRANPPKLDVFPAPQPLSDQEQALVAIAIAPSALARENLIASQHQLDVPLQISAISIPSITAPDEGRK